MAPKSSEKALRNLEYSKLPPLELLDQVADILGVNLDDLGRQYLTNSDNTSPPLSFAPREEWVLRWLLKKSDPTVADGTDEPTDPRTL
jgi:hypothetical protein